MPILKNYDVIVLGAGAAGFMAAIESGRRGRSVLLLDHAPKPAEKIRISGGGRCNFTNIYCTPLAFLSRNQHFCKSALSQYTQHDFIKWIEHHNIPYHEKTLGQLFCDRSAMDIIEMLLTEAKDNAVELFLDTRINAIEQRDGSYHVLTSRGKTDCESLVIATGGLSIPKICATGFAYDLAQQLGHKIIPTRAGLVPLVFDNDLRHFCKSLAGVTVSQSETRFGKTGFREGLLFTHKGLSGPSILQISSYWDEQSPITINLSPDHDIYEILKAAKNSRPGAQARTIIADYLPKALGEQLCNGLNITTVMAEIPDRVLKNLADMINVWKITPSGTEGYRTAEVTLGGIDTDELSSKTMESKKHKGLFFIGECVDVTGHLGGYNFQWAWSSGFVAGQYA